MALSKEWEDEHLTPSGWVSGSYRHDHKREERPVPAGTVLTVRREVVVAAVGAPIDVDESETLHTDDKNLVAELRQKFGKPRFSC